MYKGLPLRETNMAQKKVLGIQKYDERLSRRKKNQKGVEKKKSYVFAVGRVQFLSKTELSETGEGRWQ